MLVLSFIGNTECGSHDAAACIIEDGKVLVAAEQERFSRRKHAFSESPLDSIMFCLERLNLTINEIDAVAIGWKNPEDPTILKGDEALEYFKKILPEKFIKTINKMPPVYFVEHHISHICSAFYQSGFEEACCLVIDGQGENVSITLAKGNKGKIDIIKQYCIGYSLGFFYDSACAYCGLGFDTPGKLMGLAPYGQPNQEMPISFDEENGVFKHKIHGIENMSNYKDIRRAYNNYFVENNYPFYSSYNKKIGAAELMYYINFAASAQDTLETIIIGLCKFLKKEYNSDNLVLSGGVALNCTSNGKLDRSGLFKNIFIYPASNDAGCSIGSGLKVMSDMGLFNDKVPSRVRNMYYGKSYTKNDIEFIVKNLNYNTKYIDGEDLVAKEISRLLADDKVLAWFQGGFEFGPRALGHRSLIASPRNREMLYRMNEIKLRESWRPLSPIVLDKFYTDVFEDDNPDNMSDFMLKTVRIREKWFKKIPALLHIDYTSRPQILRKEQNALLYSVIDELNNLIGVPLIINTSFNIKGQPIVNDPRQAVEFLEKTKKLDYLFIDNYLISLNRDDEFETFIVNR